MSKKTLVLGATTNPARYAFVAAKMLEENGHETVLVGKRKGFIGENEILHDKIHIENLDTITLYLNPDNQKEYYDYILSLQPKRIIFNPGTENSELKHLAKAKGIKTDYACTLVLLRTGQY
ncbi:MAG: CoA-binding protein [Saprospiraceae bacterium]|nr:CoA-binding protein [Saprospiraceae bacterium]